jgi:TolB protein
MYLPQLTSGPSSAAWSPDSTTLVYSMGGSLWVQDLKSNFASQLTAGPGYDYQPDWSPDGRWIIFSRYLSDAIELWAVDLQGKVARQLTSSGAVNVEPRFSPDGNKVAFVSTSYHGHFHIFVAQFKEGVLGGVQQLTTEHISDLPRYYYSQVDHEISPVWTRDGSEILFVSNRGHIHGTGGFWRMKSEPNAAMHEIHYEETNWKARPDFSPDGTRIVYASYLGQSWHQLWVTPQEGGDPFPLSYGDFDNVNPRWSPDGSKIAFISNRTGNTSLWIQDIPGGQQRPISPLELRYLKPMAKLRVTVVDAMGHPMHARIFLTAADNRSYAPVDAWMMADDSFDRHERPFEAHYFDTAGTSEITVPAGQITIEVMHGFEYQFERRAVNVSAGKNSEIKIVMRPIQWGGFATRWVNGDVHVHMNYGGAYRNTPENLMQQASAEDVSVVENLIVNKEQRFPDARYFSPKLDPVSNDQHLLQHAQEFHTSYWGHLGLLSLKSNLILPGYAGYPNTAASSLYPDNAAIADLAHAQGALVGYVHPFDSPPDPKKDKLTYELPADVALGKVDYIEVLGFSDHKSTADVWYKLLNCGFHLPAAAGTDFMGNFASLRGPIGLNRVYAEVALGKLSVNSWLSAIKSGRTFATNGPLLRFELGGRSAGEEVRVPDSHVISFRAALGSIVPIDHLQIVCDGKVVRELPLSPEPTNAYSQGSIESPDGGWCVLRAFSDNAEYPILDSYPYATTSPIYLKSAEREWHSREDATYFIRWMDRLVDDATSSTAWNSKAEKETVLKTFGAARHKYRMLSAP